MMELEKVHELYRELCSETITVARESLKIDKENNNGVQRSTVQLISLSKELVTFVL